MPEIALECLAVHLTKEILYEADRKLGVKKSSVQLTGSFITENNHFTDEKQDGGRNFVSSRYNSLSRHNVIKMKLDWFFLNNRRG